jgi:2-polyprenyl-6-hydroxyphenyl methylase/3-demethylubiquinone-9 3-methyltransferase
LNSGHYYSDQLSADRLRQCYEIAPPRVKQYLDAEIEHVRDKISLSDVVLELGCGYGRVLEKLALKAKRVVGIDTSRSSLMFGKKRLRTIANCDLFQMSAVALGFLDRSFDVVICIQNGISAFKVDPQDLIRESVRVARTGGKVLFSSYSEKFWKDRLEWFRLQADAGLIGEIDWSATREGVIVCQDGFRATTCSPAEFLSFTSQLHGEWKIEEVDDSSLFFEIKVENR